MGKAIKLTAKENVYSETLQKELEIFLQERNWLVHKIISENIDDMNSAVEQSQLFHRIDFIGKKAHMLQRAIEEDLIYFSKSQGIDVSKIIQEMHKYYGKNPV